MRIFRKSLCLVCAFAAISLTAAAQSHKGLTFQGFLKNSTGERVTASGLTVQSKLVSPNGCVLMAESHAGVNIADGFFTLVIGKGTRASGDNGLSVKDVFSNGDSRTGFDNVGGASGTCNYTPVASDSRKLVVHFDVGGDSIDAEFNIRANGFAVWSEAAEDARKFAGKSSSEYIQTSATVTQARLEEFVSTLTSVSGGSIRWNGANFVSYDPSDATYLSSNSVPGSAITSLPYSKLTSVPAPLSTFAGLSCANGKILKMTSGAWSCGDDATGGGGGGGGAPTGAADGDLAGTYPNPTVDGIRGNAISATTPVDGQIYKWVNGSSQFQPQYLGISDLKKSDGTPQMPATCAANETLSWSSITDTLACAAIGSLDASKITSGILSASRLPADTMILACADGKIAKHVSGAWACADEGVPTEVDPTVQAYAKAAPGTGLKITSGAIVPDFGTTAGKVVEGNDARLSDSRVPSGSAGGELSGTYPNPSIAKLAGVSLNISSLASGQILKYNGTHWVNSADSGLTSESDPTVQTFAKNAPGTGLTMSSGSLVPDFGTTSGKVAQGDDSRFPASTCGSGNHSRWDGSAWICETDAQGAGGGGDFMKNGSVAMTGNLQLGGYWLSNDGGTEGINIDNSGNVAIGTGASASYKLIAGDVRAQTSGTQASFFFSQSVMPSANSSANFHNTYAVTSLSGTFNSTGSLTGSTSGVTHGSSGSASSLNGVMGSVMTVSSGSTNTARGGSFSIQVGAANTVTNAYGTDSVIMNGHGSGVITNAYAGNFTVTNAGTITNARGVNIGTIAGTNKYSLYASDATAPSYFAGSVGVGTSSPRSSLDVNGPITGKSAVLNSTSTVDFSTGNAQYTNADCGAYILWNLKDGGTYTFGVKGTNVATCSFTAFSGAGSGALTVHMPPDHTATISGSHTLYNFLLLGSDVYVSWVPGY